MPPGISTPRALLSCATVGSSAAMSLAGRSAFTDMWPYRAIGKTCMHLLTGRRSSTVQTACRRAMLCESSKPCSAPRQGPLHTVYVMSTSRVQTECYGYFECLCSASVTSASLALGPAGNAHRSTTGWRDHPPASALPVVLLTQRMGAIHAPHAALSTISRRVRAKRLRNTGRTRFCSESLM